MKLRLLAPLPVLFAFLLFQPSAHACFEMPDYGGCTCPAQINWGEFALGSSFCTSFHPANDRNDHGFPLSISHSASGPGAQFVTFSPGCNTTVPDGGQCGGCVMSWSATQLGSFATTVTFSAVGSGNGQSYSCTCSTLGLGTVVRTNNWFDPNSGIPENLPPVVRSVSASGNLRSLSVSTTMMFDPSVYGQQGSIFVGAHVPPHATFNGQGGGQVADVAENRSVQEASETWYVSNGTSWSQYQGGAIPSVFTGTLNDASALVSVLNGVAASRFCGTEFYVGYGTSGEAMLANNTLGMIYRVMCNFAFLGSSSGTNSSLTLSGNVQVATVDQGKDGNFYVGKLYNGQWSLNNGSGWVPYGGGAVPAFSSGALADRSISIFANENVSTEVGAQIYVGYGVSSDDLLNNHKYGLVYTVQ